MNSKTLNSTYPAPLGWIGNLLLALALIAFNLIIAVVIGRTADDSAQKVEAGKRLFHERCGYCHLAGGTGTIMLARRLGKDRSLLEERRDLNAEYVKKITRVGINGMPPHNRIEVPDRELDLIAIYLTRPVSAGTADTTRSKGSVP